MTMPEPQHGHTQIYETIRKVAERVGQKRHGKHGKRKPAKPQDVGLGTLATRAAQRKARRRLRDLTRPVRRKVRRARHAYRTTRKYGRATRKTAVGLARGTYRVVRHPLRTSKVIIITVLLIVLLTPYTLGGAFSDGKKLGAMVMPSGLTCTPPQQQGGYLRLAHDLGHGLHVAATSAPISRDKWDAIAASAGDKVGAFIGAFVGAAHGDPVPTVTTSAPDLAAQVALAGGCCGTTGTLPADYHPQTGDTPAMLAARAATTAGFTGQTLIEAVAVAGAESGWNPNAVNPSSAARGEWQIMLSYHQDKFAGADWHDPVANARVAKLIHDDLGTWGTTAGWSTWPSPADTYMQRAQEAVAAIQQGTTTAQAASYETASSACTTPTSNPAPGTGPWHVDTSALNCPDSLGRVDTAPGGVRIRLCDVGGGITVNASIASQVAGMRNAAAATGLTLTGGAYRSNAQQWALRRAHCPDPANSPASSCSPPTAKPGTSEHEWGLAIDFNLGVGVHAFLVANAAQYGLHQLPSEAWHWSVDGT